MKKFTCLVSVVLIVTVTCLFAVAKMALALECQSSGCSVEINPQDITFTYVDPLSKTIYKPDQTWKVEFYDEYTCSCDTLNKWGNVSPAPKEASTVEHTFKAKDLTVAPHQWGGGANVNPTIYTGSKKNYTCTVASPSE